MCLIYTNFQSIRVLAASNIVTKFWTKGNNGKVPLNSKLISNSQQNGLQHMRYVHTDEIKLIHAMGAKIYLRRKYRRTEGRGDSNILHNQRRL